jgi:NADH-quinone oxidoreductase subunit M
MVTLFVITTLSVIGLPMLNGFVGEFLVLTGSMQSEVAHHVGWTVLATTGVILTASYMLWMIQRIFYGDLNHNTADVQAPDLDAREHLALWPMVALMLLMGVASPFWMRAIDTAGTTLAREPEPVQPIAASALPPALATSTEANLHTYQIRNANLEADRSAKLNLIPAAADATKKESAIRNISTVWSSPTVKANSQNRTEAKK